MVGAASGSCLSACFLWQEAVACDMALLVCSAVKVRWDVGKEEQAGSE